LEQADPILEFSTNTLWLAWSLGMWANIVNVCVPH